MAEITSKVYDLVYPSPIPLRELSAIIVATELWRLDLKQYLEKGDFEEEFYKNYDREPKVTLQDVIRDVPSSINNITNFYLKRLVFSTSFWLHYNFNHIFSFHHDNRNQILKHFDGIVCDYNGTIHYVRTAKNMMLCDQISQDEKFKIACEYSFENDIRQIWPSVQTKVDLDEIDYDKCPHLYYWVCCLRNEMNKIPNEGNVFIGELMLEMTPSENLSSFEYFWNLVGLECRYKMAETLCMGSDSLFCDRFVLPKLSKEQLTKLVTKQGSDLIYNLWSWLNAEEGDVPERGVVVLAVWMYIKDKIDEANFIALIGNMLQDETNVYTIHDPGVEDGLYKSEDLLTCCEIWTSAADYLKRSAIKELLPKKWLFAKCQSYEWEPREIQLLSTVLLDATSEERDNFWINNWRNLLYTTRATDLHKIMKLCFENEDEIRRFKKNTLAKYENLAKITSSQFREGFIKELGDALTFICSDDEQCRRDLKRQCLQLNLLGENSVLCENILMKSEPLHEFIEDAYACNSELAINFRNQFLSDDGNVNQIMQCMRRGSYHWIIRFVDSFEPRGHNTQPLKERLIDEFREYLFADRLGFPNPHNLREFLPWCLGGEDAVIEFKQSIPADEVVHSMLKGKKSMSGNSNLADGLLDYLTGLDGYLLWYFDDDSEKIDAFKAKFDDVFKMFKPPQEY